MGSLIGFAVNAWIAVGGMRFGKSVLAYNLPVGMCTANDTVEAITTEMSLISTEYVTAAPETE
jgi:archaellum biogenesis ATPase FlaH